MQVEGVKEEKRGQGNVAGATGTSGVWLVRMSWQRGLLPKPSRSLAAIINSTRQQVEHFGSHFILISLACHSL